tara:strand:+ start:961 stop:2052 length:1092 start_codon:yes stop_codon:yes gene_type:complete
MSQIISLAEVRDTADASRSGSFLARIVELGNEEKRVKYVSPFASNGEGAFIGIPMVGVQILVCKPGQGDDWYYLGSTFEPEPFQVEGASLADATVYPLERANSVLYRSRGVPMAVQLTGPGGGGISVTEEYNPKLINNKTEIRSNVNKRITLSDSPAIDAITLTSGNGSKITIADDPQNSSIAAQSVQIETVGPQKYINTESQTDVLVGSAGRELQLLNMASGIEWGPGIPCGNVNIQSKWRDINVFTQAEQGRIFIECLNENGSNQVIQIETNGDGGAIVIKTKGDIRLDAGGNIEMKAGGQIRMQSDGGATNITCPTLEVAVVGNANIDAATIQLANGANASPPSVEGTQSTYGNTGITTY